MEAEKDDYRKIAERRVRLGLLLSDIGQKNGVEISQQEMNQLIMQAAQQYKPEDRQSFVEYIQQEPMAAAQLRAPLFEDKVVDFLFGTADDQRARGDPRGAAGGGRGRGHPCPRPGLRPRSWPWREAEEGRGKKPAARRPRLPRPGSGREAGEESRSAAKKPAAKKAKS